MDRYILIYYVDRQYSMSYSNQTRSDIARHIKKYGGRQRDTVYDAQLESGHNYVIICGAYERPNRLLETVKTFAASNNVTLADIRQAIDCG